MIELEKRCRHRKREKSYLNEKVLFSTSAFCLSRVCLLRWHLLSACCVHREHDTGSMAVSLPMQTRAQSSGNLLSDGRGKQTIMQITCCLKSRGAFGVRRGLHPPPWKKNIISRVHNGALIFLEVCLLTHESRTALPVRDHGSSQDWPGTSWKVLVPSCPSPQRVVPSLVLTPRVCLPNSTPQKWRGGAGGGTSPAVTELERRSLN